MALAVEMRGRRMVRKVEGNMLYSVLVVEIWVLGIKYLVVCIKVA